MKLITIAHIVLATISGVILIGYGGMDDSPGAQGIGLLTIVTSLLVAYTKLRNPPHNNQ
jgi:hypothetical protein